MMEVILLFPIFRNSIIYQLGTLNFMTKSFLIIWCLLISCLITAQSIEQQTDSILNLIMTELSDSIKVRHYLEITRLNFYQNPSIAIQATQKGLEISKSNPQLDFFTTNLYIFQFNAHHYTGSSSDTLLKCVQEFEEFVDTRSDSSDLVSVYWDYALYYSNINAPDKELAYYLKAFAIAEKYNASNDIQGALLSNIGDVYIKQKNYYPSINYFTKALEIVTDEIGLGVLYHSLGEAYKGLGDDNTALENFRKAYIHHEKGNDIKGMCLALIEEGKYFDRNNQFETAGNILENAFQLIEENDIGRLYPAIYLAKAEHLQYRGDFRKAIELGKEALNQMEVRKNYEGKNEAYDLLHASYAKVGDYENAYKIRGEQLKFRDTVQNTELLAKVAELQTKFEVEKREAEYKILETKNKYTLFISILGILLIGSIAVVIYRNNRQKQKYNEELKATVAEKTADLRKANENLQQANTELKTYNYIASHDIKEPIRNIGNYAEIIYRKLPQELQGDFKTYFDTVKNSTAQLYTLVEDFSRYTQLSKNDKIELQKVDLNQTVENLQLNLADVLKEKNGQIINNGLPSIHSSSSLIYTILKNIVENGLKFNQSPNPTISIAAKENDQFIELLIEDNGIGVEVSHQDQIFDMFKRLNHRHQYKGSGIGLAITKLLLNKMNGEISLKSELNKGSTFIIKLPK